MEKGKVPLDVPTIRAAVAGEAWAVEKVVEQYADEINRLATVKKKMPNGKVKRVIDEDMRQALITKLIESLPDFKEEL